MATASSRLLERKAQASRSFEEPLRPTDPRWRGRNGALRSDLGPIHPIVKLAYIGGDVPVVERQEDGSGFVCYQSGRKAVCIISKNRSRRIGAIFYAERDFVPPSAISRDGGFEDDDQNATRRPGQNRTKHLGAFDEWGCGSVQAVPPSRGAALWNSYFQVSKTNVTVQRPDGRKIVVPRNDYAALAQNAGELQLRLNGEMTVAFDAESGTTVVHFASEGLQYSFHVGEIWRAGQSSGAAAVTTPASIFDQIAISSQQDLDILSSTVANATQKLATLQQTLLPEAGGSSSSSSINGSGVGTGTGTGTLQRQQPSLTASRCKSMPQLEELAKTLVEGRISFNFERKLRKELATQVAPPLTKSMVKQSLRQGFTYPRPPIPEPPLWPQHPVQPVSLTAVSSAQAQELIANYKSKPAMLAILLTATWATGSSFSSSQHAQVICEAAYGELISQGEGGKIKFCTSDVSEAGAIHSSQKWNNPLVKQYGVKHLPWLLLFANGRNVMSGNPSPADQPNGVGLGATHSLRYPAFGKPRVLALECVPDYPSQVGFGDGMALFRDAESGALQAGRSNVFKLQLETQEVLKRAGYDHDMAVSLQEARRMVQDATPPYGLLLLTTSIGEAAISDLAARARARNSKAICLLCHDGKNVGPLDESIAQLVKRQDLVRAVFQRPLSKSRFETELKTCESVRVNYPKCGLSKETLVQLLRKYMDEL